MSARRSPITYHPTDGPHDTLLVRIRGADIGLINKPPALRGRYRAFTMAGERLQRDHPTRISAALACAFAARTPGYC